MRTLGENENLLKLMEGVCEQFCQFFWFFVEVKLLLLLFPPCALEEKFLSSMP